MKLPDSLTRYRVMAVAVSGARRFGSAEATLVARLPLMVRPSPPRFLNFGDRFELPVVVQNQTDRELSVDVAVRAGNAALTDGAGRRLVVAANDRAEVRFPMAAERAGTARIQVGAVSGPWADAAELELPVWTPATTEAFATYGELDAGAIAQPVRAPEGARPEVGGLELTTSSTALQALTDAVLYLVAYPFECAEQLSSRVLAVAALRDVLGAFQAEGLPKPEELEQAVKRDVDRLRALQNDDGGFGFWRRGERSWPYVSIHVAHALARAKAKGFPVPDEALERARRYLREIDRNIPKEYGADVRRTLQAYALSVRALLGDADRARARALVREATVDELSFEALGWLLPLLGRDEASQAEAAAIRRRIANGVSETAGAAHFAVSYGDGAHLLLHSDRRADAILLEALIADQPKSDLIPKLVAGLLAHRKAGRWASTQENVFVLLALDRYFAAYERATPDFVARAWLGERYAGSHAFRGRTTERQHTSIPMAVLQETRETRDLLLSKEGPGRLYYRIGLRYAPQDLTLGALDRGFTVERRYEGADRASDVTRDADGTWHIRAGARVRVRLTLVAEARRYHVALVDPLPAGLEASNPALATTGSLPDAGGDAVSEIGAPGLGAPRSVGALVVVDAHLVRSPEPARRPRRGVRRAPLGGRLQLPLRRARDDAGHVRRAAAPGRGDVQPRDVRPRRERPRDRRVAAQRPLRTASAARWSTSAGNASPTQRPSLPLSVITRMRWRFSIARTIRRAHSSALMISASRIGEAATVRPSGPGERLRISDCTK